MINRVHFKLRKDSTPYKDCFCRHPELIENYDKAIADTIQTWDCHHRLETHNSDGERRLVDISSLELIALGMYFDRPPEELIFLTSAEHKRLHKRGKPGPNKGKPGFWKGKPAWNKGKKMSEEQKAKISETMKGHTVSEETKRRMTEGMEKYWKRRKGILY